MRPRLLNLISGLWILLLIPASQSRAQPQQRDNRPGTASISGRVTVSGKPAANATVKVVEVQQRRGREFFSTSVPNETRGPNTFRAVTDASGRFSVTGLAAGSYQISADSKAYVSASQISDVDPAKQVTLDEGESREDLDLSLVRGGVITGRVTNAEGKPMIAARVELLVVTQQGDRADYRGFGDLYHEMFQTDDRGIYRIYGLPAGRYILSTGGGESYMPVDHSARDYKRTYFRGAPVRNKASVIEVKEGSEVTDVDIRLGSPRKTYEASGRLIEAETGQPIPRAQVWANGQDKVDGEERWTRNGRSVSGMTDGQGNFRLTGLTPGRYEVAHSGPLQDSEYFSDRTAFEVIDGNVEGLEIKAKRGASISGVAVIEGVVDPGVRELLFTRDSINIDVVRIIKNSRLISRLSVTRMEPNGEFRVSGLESGRVWFVANQWRVKGLRVLRVEHNGVEVKDGVEISRGGETTGVHVVFVQASGVVRGQVKIAGDLPENAEVHVSLTPVSDEAASSSAGRPGHQAGQKSGSADGKGRFVFEDLLPGEYHVRAYVSLRIGRGTYTNKPGLESSVQRITVADGEETPVELTINLSKAHQERQW